MVLIPVDYFGLGDCSKSITGKHNLIVFSFPNPEYWEGRIEESEYELQCLSCRRRFKVSYQEIHRKKDNTNNTATDLIT
jgi:hypothetical protein